MRTVNVLKSIRVPLRCTRNNLTNKPKANPTNNLDHSDTVSLPVLVTRKIGVSSIRRSMQETINQGNDAGKCRCIDRQALVRSSDGVHPRESRPIAPTAAA